MSQLPVRPWALPLLVLPGYVIASSLQACSSSPSSPGSTASALTCAANETSKHVGAQDVCCAAAAGGNTTCHAPGTPALGAPCSGGAPTPSASFDVTFDVCVKEACTGDRSCEEYGRLVDEHKGTLVCQGGAWQWQGTPDEHRVERACYATGRLDCGTGTTYASYGAASYASTTGTAPSYTCGYGGVYGGQADVYVRELVVLSSVCATAGGSSADCPVADL